MACSFPIVAYRGYDGKVLFGGRKSRDRGDELLLPCGQCVRCRLERSRQWAVRCVHEASLYDENSYVTLTYDDAHLPAERSLQYGDYQRFMKRLRKRFSDRVVRFYMCGEYGGQTLRPHYHACLFNVSFPDQLYFKTDNGNKLYTSRLLSELWPFGHSTVGAVTFESAAYIARYCVEKITGAAAEAHYRRVDAETGEVFQVCPEFNRMSLRPGIGGSWVRAFFKDVYPRGKVVVRGHESNTPRYYDKLLRRGFDRRFNELVHRDLVDARQYAAACHSDDNRPARLVVKEAVAAARLKFKKRSLT